MRSKKPKKKIVTPDPIYNNRLVAKLINRSMYEGKKATAQKQVYDAFNLVEKDSKKDPLEVFRAALDNIKPQLEVRTRRIGGAAYQVPTPVKGNRKESLAIRWLVTYARSRSNTTYHTYAEKLAAEILDAVKNEGGSIRRRTEVHKQAEANKAFAHFRW